jgi:hypothetical protein
VFWSDSNDQGALDVVITPRSNSRFAVRCELAGLRVQRVETKAVDQFDAMTDDELRAYVYGDKDLDN